MERPPDWRRALSRKQLEARAFGGSTPSLSATSTSCSPRFVEDLEWRRKTSAVLSSWDEMIDIVGRRPGMWVGRAKYSFVRCFVEGFGAARGDDVLRAFREWLAKQPQHHRSSYVWSALLLQEMFGHASEDVLAYPEDDAAAITHLFARLHEVLHSAAG